jgi:hypothetical protein
VLIGCLLSSFRSRSLRRPFPAAATAAIRPSRSERVKPPTAAFFRDVKRQIEQAAASCGFKIE